MSTNKLIALAISAIAVGSIVTSVSCAAYSVRVQRLGDSGEGSRRIAVGTTTQYSVKATSGEREDNQQGENEGRGGEHRSAIANLVQRLKYVGNKEDGLGEKVREFAKEQASSSKDVADAADQVEKKGSFRTFLFGSDYKNLGKIRSEIAKTSNRIDKLNRDIEGVASSTEKNAVIQQITAMKDEQTKLQNFVQTNESKFSLFGWFTKLFQR